LDKVNIETEKAGSATDKIVNKFAKAAAAVIDVFPDLCGAQYSSQTVRQKMEHLQKLGFTRVYLVNCAPGYPNFSNPWLDIVSPDNDAGNFAVENILTMGDPIFEHIYEAHRYGLEAFAIIKPYEGGGGYTIPHGQRNVFPSRNIPCLGGDRIGFDTFLAEHPYARVKRKPIPNYEQLIDQPVTRIRLAFCLDRIEEKLKYEQVGVYEPKQDDSIQTVPMKGLTLWLSHDNGTYERYEGPMDIEENLQLETIRDANGIQLYDEPKRSRVVDISNLAIPADVAYIAVTMDMAKEHLVTLPYSMIQMYGEAGEIPATCTPYVRTAAHSVGFPSTNSDPYSYRIPQNGDQIQGVSEQFATTGFEFDWYGSGGWGKGWSRSNCYGIAKGKIQYMKGTHCEAYPEVREYWLEQVRKLIAMGIDGVDFRLQNHSGMISDYANFGYNEPIVEAYLEQHGVDILQEEADPLHIMRIRGAFYTQFIEQAAEVLHQSGKVLQVHLRHSLEAPLLSSSFGELGFWAMPKVLPDWEKLAELADEITIKDYNWSVYRSETATKIKDRAAALNKPLWVHCYIAQGGDLNPQFTGQVLDDERVTGMLLYEMGHNPHISNPYVGLLEVNSDGDVIINPVVLEKLEQALNV
jgi:hypothetical protein